MVQPRIPPTPAETNLSGKTIIITGGNAGLGYDAARQYLTLGASRLILACRSVAKGEEAAASLRADATVKKSNPDASIEVFELNLDDYQSGLRFSNKVKQEVKELDILLNNGGQIALDYKKSKSNHEQNMQVNCYTHLLISLELFPLLRSTAAIRGLPSRITFTGSGTQITQNTLTKKPISPDSTVIGHFDDEANYNKYFRYADTKTVVNAYVRRLAALAPSEVIANNPCPGLVQTGFDKNLPFYLRLPMALVRKAMGRTVEEGARTLVYASAVAGPEANGKFLQHNKVDPGAAFLNAPEGEEFINKLWKENTELMFDFAARLFHTAEQYQSSWADAKNPASLITNGLESMSDDDLQSFISNGEPRIEGINREDYDADLKMSLTRIARAAIDKLELIKRRSGDGAGRAQIQ